MNVVMETNIPDLPKKKGKVRDVYDLGDKLLIVTTDRISAFDWVLPTGIPNKGRVLNSLSEHWLGELDCANHLLSTDLEEMVQFSGVPSKLADYNDMLEGRCMLVEKLKPLPIEFIVRGYLTGSAWKEYVKTGKVAGISLPKGLKENFAFPEPMFTPSTKAETGHDQNITVQEMIDILVNAGYEEELCWDIQELSIEIYKKASRIAFDKGILIADTKFEWSCNHLPNLPILIDEVLTPDSSRLWAVENYCLGKPVESYDKQFVRDWLEQTGWDKNSPPPELPNEIVERTSQKYLEAYKAITGRDI